MNLYLHGIGGNDSPITVGDTLISDPGIRFDKVLTNPPFGKKSSITIVNEGGKYDKETVIDERHVILTHPKRPAYPSKADLERLGINGQ